MLVSLTDTVEEVSGLCERVHKRTRGLHFCDGLESMWAGSLVPTLRKSKNMLSALPLPCTFQGLEMDRVSHEKLHSTGCLWKASAQSLEAPSSDVGRGHRGILGSFHLPVTSCCSMPCSLVSAGFSHSGESGNMVHRCPESSKFCHHTKN